MPALLEISCNAGYNEGKDTDICMGAVTLLRKHVDDRWDSRESHISESDRKIVKENLVPSMTKCTNLTVMKNLEDCIYSIAVDDYPGNWDCVLMQIGESMNSDDDQVCYASLCALRAIVSTFKLSLGQERKPLIEITQNAFGMLETLFQKHLEIFSTSSVLIMTVLTKIFFFANYVVECPFN